MNLHENELTDIKVLKDVNFQILELLDLSNNEELKNIDILELVNFKELKN